MSRGFAPILGFIKAKTKSLITLDGGDLPGPVTVRLASLALTSRLHVETKEIGVFVELSVMAGAKERAMHTAMRARLEAEKSHGFPNSGGGGTVGHWTDYSSGYVDLNSYPLVHDHAAAGLEPIPPDEQQLLDYQVRQPQLTDVLEDEGDKISRRQARRGQLHEAFQ